MIPFRYHLASLAAVFLALGIGLLAGASLAGGGRLTDGQSALIREIQASLADLRSENAALEERLRAADARLTFYDQVLAATGDARFGQALAGTKLALFAEGSAQEAAGSLRAYLRGLGADVTAVTWRAAGGDGDRGLGEGHLAALADLLAYGRVPEALAAFVADGTLQTDSAAHPADAVVILAADAGERIERGLPGRLAAALAGQGRAGVVAHVGPAPARDTAWAGAWERVPFVETLAGRVAVAAALAAAVQGREAP